MEEVAALTDKVSFQHSAESSNCYSLLPPLPDLPFCEESSSPPCSPMPDLQQVDLDALLNDEGMTGEM